MNRRPMLYFAGGFVLAMLWAATPAAGCSNCPPPINPNVCLVSDIGFGGYDNCAIFTATIEQTGGTLKWCIEMDPCSIQGPPDYGGHCSAQPLDPACDGWGDGGGGGDDGGDLEPEEEEP